MVLRLRFSDSSDFSMRPFVSDSTDAAETGDPSSSSLLVAAFFLVSSTASAAPPSLSPPFFPPFFFFANAMCRPEDR